MDERGNDILMTLKEKCSQILPLNSRAVLFGSRARGDYREDSDWDIHILIPGEEVLSLNEIGKYARPIEELGWDLNEYFSVLVYSHEGWKKRHFLPFYKNVETEKIIIYNSLSL